MRRRFLVGVIASLVGQAARAESSLGVECGPDIPLMIKYNRHQKSPINVWMGPNGLKVETLRGSDSAREEGSPLLLRAQDHDDREPK